MGKDKRRDYRVDTPGAEAICRVNGFGDHYVMVDLSIGGARLRWGRRLDVGTQVHMVLMAGTFGMLEVDGMVTHHGGDGLSIGITFDPAPPPVRERLEDMVVDAIIDDYGPAGSWALPR